MPHLLLEGFVLVLVLVLVLGSELQAAPEFLLRNPAKRTTPLPFFLRLVLVLAQPCCPPPPHSCGGCLWKKTKQLERKKKKPFEKQKRFE
jgi:hypothetical protein